MQTIYKKKAVLSRAKPDPLAQQMKVKILIMCINNILTIVLSQILAKIRENKRNYVVECESWVNGGKSFPTRVC